MRPKRYPYSGEKESTFVKADHVFLERLLRPSSIIIDSQSLTTKLQAKNITD